MAMRCSFLLVCLLTQAFEPLHVFGWTFVPLQSKSAGKGTSTKYSRNILHSALGDISAEEALSRTAAHLQKLQRQHRSLETQESDESLHPEQQRSIELETLYRQYLLQSANSLKSELARRNLPNTGRKPELARRLAEHDLGGEKRSGEYHEILESASDVLPGSKHDVEDHFRPVTHFAGIALSEIPARALTKAQFTRPSPIQAQTIPAIYKGESVVVHAETGSGKTLAYLLPIIEKLWSEGQEGQGHCVVLTPTRELAAQVAGIATVLAPPGSVRLLSRATNLAGDGARERGELDHGGRPIENSKRRTRIVVGSAKAVAHSLYGDGVLPAPPTPKPQALDFLKSVRWLVLDEVDRVLAVGGKKTASGGGRRHEKPGAVVAAAVARHTLGRSQVVAVSATVGRPLKRELARVLGLGPQDSPRVLRPNDEAEKGLPNKGGRAVTIPDSVRNFYHPVADSSPGKLLTGAFRIVQALTKNQAKARRILFVLTKGYGISTQNTIGALKHFDCKPEPQSLLDALEADGTTRMMEKHREVSRATGVGEAQGREGGESYLFVTGEDTVRGLHLDGLDFVIVLGGTKGPDEYTHIAGRTGRAGRTGVVINVLSEQNASTLTSWEKMLETEFEQISLDTVENLD